MNDRPLDKKLARVSELSTLPTVVNNVIQITQNPKSSAMQVGEAISRDQTLTSNVLRMVNSAYYGFPRKITTITHAIVVLGFSNIRNLVLTTSIFKLFTPPGNGPCFDLEGFWKHSLACGVTAKMLAAHMGMKNLEEVFLWGLLHDLGKLVLVQYFPEEYQEVILRVAREDVAIRNAEKAVLGFDHAAVGHYVGNNWNLPPALLKAIRFHHLPTQAAEAKRIVALVHTADALCRALSLGNGGDLNVPQINQSCWELVGLDKPRLKRLFGEIEDEMAHANELLHLI